MIKGIVKLYRQAYSGLPREAWLLFAVNLVNSSGAMVIFFLSLYLTRQLGFTPARAGQALSLYGLGSLAGGYLGGLFSDRLGSTSVQKLSLSLSSGFLIILGQVRSAGGILPVLFLFSVAAGAVYPTNAASISRVCPPELQVKGFALNRLANNLGVTRRASPETRGRYIGIFSLAFSLAFIVRPAGGASVYGHLGGKALWFGCAGVSGLLAVAFSALRRLLDPS